MNESHGDWGVKSLCAGIFFSVPCRLVCVCVCVYVRTITLRAKCVIVF